jgi:hypothetical protein
VFLIAVPERMEDRETEKSLEEIMPEKFLNLLVP